MHPSSFYDLQAHYTYTSLYGPYSLSEALEGPTLYSLDYESSEVRRVDSFITPGIEDSFSALTQNFAFLPRKLMARFLAQNGSD